MKHLTGDVAASRGVYLPDCRCLIELLAERGKSFPKCPKCDEVVIWHFVRSVWSDASFLGKSLPDPPPPPS